MKILYVVLLLLLSFLVIIKANTKEQKYSQDKYDYYFMVDSSGYEIFTNEWDFKQQRYVEKTISLGRLKYGDNPTLDSLIDLDNQ